MSHLEIYGVESSPFVRKTLVLLEEKSLSWQLHEINVFDPPTWFLEISPAKRIPVLRVGDYTLPDSSAICGYLEKAYPEPPLYPQDAEQLGQALWLEEYADTVLAAKIGFGLLRTLISAPRMGQPPDLDRARKAISEDLPPVFDYLESVINGTYAVGESFTIADIALVSQLAGLVVTRVELDAQHWPKLAGYMNHILCRDSFQARLAAIVQLMPAEPFLL